MNALSGIEGGLTVGILVIDATVADVRLRSSRPTNIGAMLAGRPMGEAISLVPMLFTSDIAGTEILHPVAVAIFGGLISSTLLDTFTTPVLFHMLGERALARVIDGNAQLAYDTF